jgi:DNA-binding MarR family transcriptional regulator
MNDFISCHSTPLEVLDRYLCFRTQRAGLVAIARDPSDARNRKPRLTDEGCRRLAAALPDWRRAHDALDAGLTIASPDAVRQALEAMA